MSAGGFLGGTVSGNSSCNSAIKRLVLLALKEVTNADVVITELGGTIGDIESQPLLTNSPV